MAGDQTIAFEITRVWVSMRLEMSGTVRCSWAKSLGPTPAAQSRFPERLFTAPLFLCGE
jgi:hypothetical protein